MSPKIVDEPIILDRCVIERALITPEGFYGVCIYTDIGHRCGYVGVQEDHPLYGVHYYHDDLSNVRVHGGLTYAEDLFSPIPEILECEGYWFFGFDCAHGGDGREAAHGFTLVYGSQPGAVRRLDYVFDQVLKLSAQLTPQAIMQSKMESGE